MSPITSSSFENQTPGQALCDAFQEKLLNNSKMQQLLDYLFNDSDGSFSAALITDLMSFTAPVGSYKEFPTDLPSGAANPTNGIVYVEASGQELLRADYARLFSFYGTAFNQSTDSDVTKFRVPDLGGKFRLGRNGSHVVGSSGGEASHALLPSENAPHQHKVISSDNVDNLGGGTNTPTNVSAATYIAGASNKGGTGNNSYTLASTAVVADVGLSALQGGEVSTASDAIPFTGYDDKYKAVPHNNMPPFITGVVYVVAGYKVSGAMV